MEAAMATSARLRRAVSRTPFAPIAAFPFRLSKVVRYDLRILRLSGRWLVTSREHHNYTYDLTALNREHLAWFVSDVCATPVRQVRGWMAELESDDELRRHIENTTATSTRRGLADRRARYARRAGWYAMVRAHKPARVVETGTDKGLGTCVIAAALLRNAAEGYPGRVTSIDLNPEAGYLTKAEPWAGVIDVITGDSVAALAALTDPVDIFLHDSDHSAAHERRELTAIEPNLAKDAIVLTDNVTKTRVLAQHAEATERRFLAFREQPARHWYPGDGIGAAWR
jgi:predicted O-methyltransferase YrrM